MRCNREAAGALLTLRASGGCDLLHESRAMILPNGQNSGDVSRGERSLTGVPGLDEVLCGGITPNRLYLIEGAPGTGKTTLSLQFLLDGVAKGETCVYITLSET